jgi:hypothetical protein
MPSNSIRIWLNPDEVPEISGPDELAHLLISYRQTVDENLRSNLSEEVVRRVVSAAFCASLIPDEGRYPRFRLFVSSFDALTDPLPLSFQERREIGVQSLRRLASAFNPETHAIVVAVEEDGLWCRGVISIERPLSSMPSDQPAFSHQMSGAPGLELIADGPGELRLSEAGLSLRLRGGRISELVPVDAAKAVRNWLQTTAETLSRRLSDIRVQDPSLGMAPRLAMENMLADLISRIFEAIVYQRHGGAIALLPENGWEEHVHFAYPASGVHVGRLLVEYWEAFLDGQKTPSPDQVRLVHLKRDEILLSCRSLSMIANTDGCVGLSKELDLRGFGGEIRVSAEEARKSPRVFWNVAGGREWADQTGSDLGGTRHRSAFRLCKVVAHCLVLVVSQDGELTLMASDETSVHCVSGLNPVRNSAS